VPRPLHGDVRPVPAAAVLGRRRAVGRDRLGCSRGLGPGRERNHDGDDHGAEEPDARGTSALSCRRAPERTAVAPAATSASAGPASASSVRSPERSTATAVGTTVGRGYGTGMRTSRPAVGRTRRGLGAVVRTTYYGLAFVTRGVRAGGATGAGG